MHQVALFSTTEGWGGIWQIYNFLGGAKVKRGEVNVSELDWYPEGHYGVICYFYYLKSIVNSDSFQEFEIYAIVLKIYCFNWFPLKYILIIRNSLLFQLVARNIYLKQSLRGAPWNQFKWENIETSWLHWLVPY